MGGAWVNSLSDADDMVHVSFIHGNCSSDIQLEVCCAYAGPPDININTMKTVCLLVRPKQSQGRFSTRVRLGNEELSFVEEFRYLEHVMGAHCQDDNYIKKTIQEAKCSWQYTGQ